MTQRAPGKAYRKGLTFLQVAEMFRDEAEAEAWIAERRWPNGPHCPDCGSFHVQSGIKQKTMTYRCRDCDGRPMFTLRSGGRGQGPGDEAGPREGGQVHRQSVKEYVCGQVHTNGVESFWSMLKRGYIGIYHKMSPKHLNRYVTEFEGRHNDREHDTIAQMRRLVEGMGGKHLTYEELTAPNGLPSGARGA